MTSDVLTTQPETPSDDDLAEQNETTASGGGDTTPVDATDVGGMTGGTDGPVSTAGNDGSGGNVCMPPEPSGWAPEPGFEAVGTITFAQADDPSKDSYWFLHGFEQGYNQPTADTVLTSGPVAARNIDLFRQGAVAGKRAATQARDAANAAIDAAQDGPAFDVARDGQTLDEIKRELFEQWSQAWHTDEQPDVEREEFDPMWSTAPQWSGQVVP